MQQGNGQRLSTRILKEIANGYKSSLFQFYVDDNGEFNPEQPGLAYCRFVVKSGLYEGQTHVLSVKFIHGNNSSNIYPRNPPEVKFKTPIFHPNVAYNGTICLDVLKQEKWSSMYGIETIFVSICTLLNDPNADSPLNCDAAKIHRKGELGGACQGYYADQIKIADKSLRNMLTSENFNVESSEKK